MSTLLVIITYVYIVLPIYDKKNIGSCVCLKPQLQQMSKEN